MALSYRDARLPVNHAFDASVAGRHLKDLRDRTSIIASDAPGTVPIARLAAAKAVIDGANAAPRILKSNSKPRAVVRPSSPKARITKAKKTAKRRKAKRARVL